MRWLLAVLAIAGVVWAWQPAARVEAMRGKTVMMFTPHPDDDTFCCAGTLGILAKNGNKVLIVIYTNDDKGLNDPEMMSERLARIRKYRPDVVMTIDPGAETVRWHKTDHRMAAMNTLDAVRAAEWHLYFPNQRLQQGLEPFAVPLTLYYYVTPQDANYWVDIDSWIEKKLDAAAAHVSQFEPSIQKYRADWDGAELRKLKDGMRARAGRSKRDGHYVEAFRVATSFSQQ